MVKRPTILLSNDDGIEAPGLTSLWRALREADIADLVIIAPSKERSGVGVGITWDRPMQIRKVEWVDNTPAWSVDGTPADCIKLGSSVILDFHPDFIISGINPGSNAGRNILHSGTIGAVIEGVFRGIPGAAISCENLETPNFHVAEKSIAMIVEYLIAHPLPSGSFLNVTYPHSAQDEVKGFKLTRQGRARWVEDPSFHLENEHGPQYWLGGKFEDEHEEEESDIAYLKEGYMTAVPIHVHDLTDSNELKLRRDTFEDFFSKKSRPESIK